MNKKRSKLWAILGASVLTLGVVSIAMAIELKEAHQGLVISWDDEGNPVLPEGFVNSDECPTEPGEGEVIVHFVQTQATAGAAGTNLIDVDFDGAPDANDVPEDSIQGGGANVDWFVSTTSDGGDVTIVTANTNIPGDQLVVSHICVGDAPPEETAPPSFEQSQEGETDEPSEPVITDEPSFEQSQQGETDAPTEPNTAALGSNGTSAPADGAWLLVVALGVLLASIVVLSPARAKGTR
jgi:hypothetical protein